MKSYWATVNDEAVAATMDVFHVHRAKVFAAALIHAVAIAGIWGMFDTEKALIAALTIGAWVLSAGVVWIYHLFTLPPRLSKQQDEKIEGLQNTISKRLERIAAADKLKELYRRNLVLGVGPTSMADFPKWRTDYQKWIADAEVVIRPMSENEYWMFMTLGDASHVGIPINDQAQLALLLGDLLSKRSKLRLIISRVLPSDDPLYETIARTQE